MHDIAFLITNKYQIHHFGPIARALPGTPSFVIELRDHDFGVDEELIEQHVPGASVDWIAKRDLSLLDGRFDLIVCQTPVLPQVFLSRTLVVAQQYSLAKERYQYGVWRSLADLNLMYGRHSVDHIDGFTNALAVGNPMFDDYFADRSPAEVPPPTAHSAADDTVNVLYLPTYGSLSSLPTVIDRLRDISGQVTVKLHHMAHDAERRSLPPDWVVADADADPVALLASSDVVVSDYSGAAFDAAYARRPVVLVGEVPTTALDIGRLSAADLGRSALGSLAVELDATRPFADVVDEARSRLDDTAAYLDFVDRHFTNHGTAAQACASAITDVLEHGPPDRFGWSQVRQRNQDLMQRNRRLNDEIRRLRATNDRLRTGPGRRINRQVERAARRGRAWVARSPKLERRAVEIKHRAANLRRSFHPASDGTVPMGAEADDTGADGSGARDAPRHATPWAARADLADRLRRLSAESGLHLPDVEIDDRAHFALRSTDRPRFVEVAHLLAKELPGVEVVTTVAAVPGGTARSSDIRTDQNIWLRVSSAHWTTEVPVHVTATQPSTGRELALDRRAPLVDWTSLFRDRSDQRAAADRAPRPRRLARHFDGPIDVVYTWVDSSDPAWQRSRERYSGGDPLPPSADNDERFLDRDELRYSLRSLWTYAPFIRKVYLVTSGQRPSWLDLSDDRVELVTHDEIFPADAALPTFNSHAIEACLHRIPGLAEHFVYLNDDVFFGREVTPDAFFTRAGLPKVRLAPSQFVSAGRPRDDAIPTDWAAFNAINLVERDFGLIFDRKHQHVPHALTVSVLDEMEQRYPAEFAVTRQARFRSATDLAVPSMFAHYFGVASRRAVEERLCAGDYVYADTGRADAHERFEQILRSRPAFFCLNSTLHRAVPLPDQALAIRQLLDSLLPTPSPYERPGDAALGG